MDERVPWSHDPDEPSLAPDRPPGLDGLVRWSDPGDIAAGLPHLLGFPPYESLVLLGLSGGRLSFTVRADIPPLRYATDVARSLAQSLSADRPSGAVLAVVSEASDDDAGERVLPHLGQVRQVLLALGEYGISLDDAILVRSGRWWSYFCAHACCREGAGTPLPGGVSALAAASVAAGAVVRDSREALAAQIARPPDLPPGMADACLRLGRAAAGPAPDDGGTGGDGTDDADERGWAVVIAAVDRCGSPGRPARHLTDDDVARIVWALRDVRVRDRALGLSLGSRAPAAEGLWTECTRRAPSPLDAAPATLLAVSAWLRGDGAMANIALDRALDSEPDYALAGLLAQGLRACLHPRDLRSMIVGVLADLGATDDLAPTAGGAVRDLGDLATLGGWLDVLDAPATDTDRTADEGPA